jgi:hypothetical protein
MNSTRKSITRAGFAATFAALALAATACGTEDGTTTPSASIKQATPQKESRISPLAAERQAELQEQARKLRAERAEAKRWAQDNDTAEHPPGSFHADTQCRREGHPSQGGTTCEAAPQQAPTAARPGSYKFPDLLP